MEEYKTKLQEINTAANDLYAFVEHNQFRITRRRLLAVQTLVFIDINTNAAFRLLDSDPPYLDGAEMILRSMYEMTEKRSVGS